MKKALIFVIAVVLSLMLAITFSTVGCKEEAAPAEEAAEETAPAEEAGEVMGPENEVELDWWFQDWTAGIEITTEFTNEVMAKYPNIKINIIPITYESLTEKTIPALSAGTEPDVIFGYASYLEELDPVGLLLPLTPDIMSKAEAESIWYKSVLQQMEGSDGNYYMLPWGCGGDGYGAVVHNELMEAAGVEFTPGVITEWDTWDKIVDAAAAATQYNDDGSIKVSGISMDPYLNSWPIFPSFAMQLGAQPFKDGVWDWTEPASKQAMEALNKLVTDKIFDPQGGDAYTALPQGSVAMGIFGAWAIGALGVDYPELELSFTSIPPINPDNLIYSSLAWGGYFFSKKAADDPDKLAAVKAIAAELSTSRHTEIAIEKWAGLIANLEFLEGFQNGTIVPKTDDGKRNAAIGVDLTLSHVPYIVYYEGSKIGSSTIGVITGNEMSALFTGQQDVDTTLQNLTDLLNEEEALR